VKTKTLKPKNKDRREPFQNGPIVKYFTIVFT
jgi:hypothetical protein